MTTTVISKIGANGVNRDYATLALWQTAKAADITASDEIHVAELYDDAEFTVAFDLTGWTTDATRYVII